MNLTLHYNQFCTIFFGQASNFKILNIKQKNILLFVKLLFLSAILSTFSLVKGFLKAHKLTMSIWHE